MTNIFKSPEKKLMRGMLFKAGVDALWKAGWKVEKAVGLGKSSVRRITRDGTSRLVSIRTTQDTWIAFPRTSNDSAWLTLDDVDVVLAVSVDDPHLPRFAQVHMIEATEMKERFDRAYAARKSAGYSMHIGRGVWISLYEKEASEPVTLVGAGAGLAHPAIAKTPLEHKATEFEDMEAKEAGDEEYAPLSIAEAKRRLALTLGVDPSAVKITIEG